MADEITDKLPKICQEKIKLPNGEEITKDMFTFYFLKALSELHDYDAQLEGLLPDGLFHRKVMIEKIQDLDPKSAAGILANFSGEGKNPREQYEGIISQIRPFAEDNPAIYTVVKVIDEKTQLLEQIAKKAAPTLLKMCGLGYLV